MTLDPFELDATAQAALVRNGQASPRELVDAAIHCIETLDPQVNAVIHRQFDSARAECESGLPDGPFRGVPIVVKDSLMQQGEPVFLGMRVLREADWRASFDDGIVTKLRRAGFVIVGRANAPELFLQATTEPRAFGATHNPWALDRTVGGSSGGSAAAVASGMVAVAHANDGAGSTRIPASVCGLVGLKASRGRVSIAPLAEAPGGMAVEGALCRSVRDAAALLDVLAGPMPGDPHPLPLPPRPFAAAVISPPRPMRIAVDAAAPDGLTVDPAVTRAVEAAAAALESLGHVVTDGTPPVPSFEELRTALVAGFAVSTAAFVAYIERLVGRAILDDELEPVTVALARRAHTVSGLDVATHETFWAGVSRRLGQWWAGGRDLLLTPIVRTPTPRIGDVVRPTDDPFEGWLAMWEWIPYTAHWNVTGNPAISLPTHDDDGLPIGVQLVAPYGAEDRLLRVAAQLEQALPWSGRRPSFTN